MSKLTALETLDLTEYSASLTSLMLDELTALQVLNLRDCSRLTSLSLNGATALQTLNLGYCTRLTSLPSLDTLTALQTLDLTGCTGLTLLQSVDGLEELQELTALQNLSIDSGRFDLRHAQIDALRRRGVIVNVPDRVKRYVESRLHRRVKVSGLVKKPELNGRCGITTSCKVGGTKAFLRTTLPFEDPFSVLRFAVLLDGEQAEILVKPANLLVPYFSLLDDDDDDFEERRREAQALIAHSPDLEWLSIDDHLPRRIDDMSSV